MRCRFRGEISETSLIRCALLNFGLRDLGNVRD